MEKEKNENIERTTLKDVGKEFKEILFINTNEDRLLSETSSFDEILEQSEINEEDNRELKAATKKAEKMANDFIKSIQFEGTKTKRKIKKENNKEENKDLKVKVEEERIENEERER